MYAPQYHDSNPEVVKILLAAGAQVNAADNEWRTPVMLVAQLGNASAVRMLLENGMSSAVNARDKRGRTALMYVHGYSYDEPASKVVRTLMSAGADVNATDEEGRTALMFAVEAGSTDAVKALIELGASVNAKDRHGRTALMWSVASPRPYMEELVQYLLKAGADASAKDDKDQTALALAKQNGYDVSILDLLKAAETHR